MRGLGWRWVLAVLATTGFPLLAPGLTSADTGPTVLPLPALTSSTTITSYKGHKVLEVLEMHVTKIARGAQLLVTCGCRRRLVPIHETRTATSRTFRDVDWLLTPGHAIHVAVTEPPALGRYLVLVSNTQHHQLVFQTDGCLTPSKTPQPCPSGVTTIPTGTTVTSTSGTGTSGTGTSGTGGTGTGGITNSAVEIAAGEESACALLSNSSIDCWGENLDGELGDGTDTGPDACSNGPCSATPVPVSGITDATAISVGDQAACAVLPGGSIDCWGANAYGQLGNGTAATSTTPVAVTGITNATAVAVGEDSACALVAGGTIDCWGINLFGELGNGTAASSTTPVAVSGITNATAIAVGADSACAVLTGGTIDCWGNSADGELGDGTDTGPDRCAYDNPCSMTPVAVTGLTNATAVSVGEYTACALLSGGGVDCWGDNDYGALGNGTNATTELSTTPVPVTGLTNATAIALGDGSACALLSVGSIECWGNGDVGELGNATTDDSSIPVPVSGLASATDVTSGSSSPCALVSGGTVYCWGENDYGELGNSSTDNSTTPVRVSGLG